MERALRWALAQILPYPGRFRLALRAAQLGRPFAGLMPTAAAGDAGVRAARAAAAEPDGRAAGLPRRGRAAEAGGAADRLRAAGARHRHQRGDDPAPHPPRLRGGGRRGRGLLRGADPPHGQGAREPCLGGEEHPRLDARGARGGARRGGRQHLGLRHDGEGLRRTCSPGDPLAADAAAVAAAGARRLRADGGARARAGERAAAAGRLSRRLLAAARPADPRRSRRRCCKAAGFEVVEPRDSHLCCGSAGTYNLLQPEICGELRAPQGGDARGEGAAGDRRRQHRLHDADRRRRRRCRWCIPPSSSTGRPAGRGRRRSA